MRNQVNASDNRGKADAKISKGIGGSNANCIKELVSNEALAVNMDRLIMQFNSLLFRCLKFVRSIVIDVYLK